MDYVVSNNSVTRGKPPVISPDLPTAAAFFSKISRVPYLILEPSVCYPNDIAPTGSAYVEFPFLIKYIYPGFWFYSPIQ